MCISSIPMCFIRMLHSSELKEKGQEEDVEFLPHLLRTSNWDFAVLGKWYFKTNKKDKRNVTASNINLNNITWTFACVGWLIGYI